MPVDIGNRTWKGYLLNEVTRIWKTIQSGEEDQDDIKETVNRLREGQKEHEEVFFNRMNDDRRRRVCAWELVALYHAASAAEKLHDFGPNEALKHLEHARKTALFAGVYGGKLVEWVDDIIAFVEKHKYA